jgi:DNA modification methylase
MSFGVCPRCREMGYEKLKSYSHCVNCEYSPELFQGSKNSVGNWCSKLSRKNLNPGHSVHHFGD